MTIDMAYAIIAILSVLCVGLGGMATKLAKDVDELERSEDRLVKLVLQEGRDVDNLVKENQDFEAAIKGMSEHNQELAEKEDHLIQRGLDLCEYIKVLEINAEAAKGLIEFVVDKDVDKAAELLESARSKHIHLAERTFIESYKKRGAR